MPEATEQGSHPNPKPATQSQAGGSGNRSGGNRSGRSGHKGTHRPQSQEHHQQRHGGSRRPPPGIGGEEHSKGSHHGRNHDGGGKERHSDSGQTSGKRSASEHRGNSSKGDGSGSSSRSQQHYYSKGHSAARQAQVEGERTPPPRGKPPGQLQMAAKFPPATEQKSQVQRTEIEESAVASSPAVQAVGAAVENSLAESKFADPSIVEQKEAGGLVSVEEQQRHAHQLHMQMQQQQFLQQLALAQQLYFQQFQQQAVQRMAAMMAAQQLQQQQQEESKQGEEEKLIATVSEKEQPEDNAANRQGESAADETQIEGLQSMMSSRAESMPESSQQMVSDEVSEQELARHLDMFMKEQGLVTGNDLAERMADQLVFQSHDGQQLFEPSSSHADESELVHPYTQDHPFYSGTSEGYKGDPSLSVTAMGDMSAFSHANPSQDQSFFAQPGNSSDTSLSMSHVIGASGPLNSQPPVDSDLVPHLQGTHSYSTTPPLQTTATALLNGRSTNSPFDFSHDTSSRPFTGFSDHSSEHSWLGDAEPHFASLASDPTGFESVGVGNRPSGRGTDVATQPDARRQRKGGNHKPSPSQVTLEVGGRMFFVFPATFQSYPDSVLNQVLNGSNPVKLNERHAIAFDRDGFIFDILLSFCRTGRLTIPPSISFASVLDEARFFRLDKYLCDPKFARPPRYRLTFKRERPCRLAMKNEPGCQMSCLFVVRGEDQLFVKEIKESSMRLLVDVTTETGDVKAKDYTMHDPQHPRSPLPTLRGGYIYSFHLGLPMDISRGVPIPTMDVVFQELVVFGDKEQLVNASTYTDRD